MPLQAQKKPPLALLPHPCPHPPHHCRCWPCDLQPLMQWQGRCYRSRRPVSRPLRPVAVRGRTTGGDRTNQRLSAIYYAYGACQHQWKWKPSLEL
jgi:hypothetical protein